MLRPCRNGRHEIERAERRRGYLYALKSTLTAWENIKAC